MERSKDRCDGFYLAAKIMYPEAGATEIKQKAADYEKLQDSAASAAARGYVDRLIDPADTRKYLVAAFEMLYTKYVSEPEKETRYQVER